MAGATAPRPQGPAASAPAGGDQSDSAMNSLRAVLEDIRKDYRNQYACTPTYCPDIDLVRQEQRRFLKGANKFPDFIDIGIDIWERFIDWHVKYQQHLAISRTGEGRYIMTFGVTTLVLRPDMSGSYMGLGYDNK
jgi:hypothetical protein